MQPTLIKRSCQNCGKLIEFDATGLEDTGESIAAACPYCGLQTTLAVTRRSQLQVETQKSARNTWYLFGGRGDSLNGARWFQRLFTSKCERFVFGLIRSFALLLAIVILLGILISTSHYFFDFPKFSFEQAGSASTRSIYEVAAQAEKTRDLFIYLFSVLVGLVMLTGVSLLLIVLAIERNGRDERLS